ncbi:isochorismatase family protein [Pseudonocardia pini]|uniref:isochorismatase family protein n=1 Tax=Pseudonocardia pini TaxID=2758030 RepID=UPI0015F0DB51|nr:isochorismatase family protein [Pseudonocardia pini]
MTDGKTALLVIDVQQGNTAEGWDRDGVLGRIRGLIDRARADGVPVIWLQHEAGPFVPGSETWQIAEAVRPGAGDTVLGKRYLDSFADTDLKARLDALGATRLVLCGAATDACIRSTAARSQVEGYDTVLVADGHTTDEGPWDLPLPDGTTVPVGAREMVAFTNFFVADTEYPGVTTEVVPAADVTW